jgi:uroporphyrinogen-III synthase
MTDPEGATMPVPPAVVCIGPVTAAGAQDAGLEVAVTADEPSVDGVVAALVAHFGSSSR